MPFRLDFVLMWEAFTEIPSYKRVFLKPTKPLVSMSSPPAIGGQYFLGLSESLFSGAAALVPLHRGLRVLGNMVGYSKLVQSESGEKHIPVLFSGALLKLYWKREMHKDDLMFQFCIIASVSCKDLDVRLYIDIADSIGRKEIDLLSERP